MKNLTLIETRFFWVKGKDKPLLDRHYFQMRGNQRHFFRQIEGRKLKRMTDEKEKANLMWFYQRYYPNGDRI